jgi:hypothetical protein
MSEQKGRRRWIVLATAPFSTKTVQDYKLMKLIPRYRRSRLAWLASLCLFRLPMHGTEGDEMTFATHRERQFMEYLLGKGWVRGTTLPPSRLTVILQKRGWIEQQVQGPKNEIFHRMTDVGLKALRAPVPAGRSSTAKEK